MYVSSLHIYPIKGCRAVPVEQVDVEPWGCTGDRRWMVVDETGRYLSQRERPELARIVAGLTDGGVEARAEGMEPLAVKEPEPAASRLVPVRVWGSELEAVEADPEGHEWFSDYLHAAVRLVWLDDPYRRPPHSTYGTPAAFSDGFPLLVTNTASLDSLNDWLAEAGDEPLPMSRFRPNLVVSGAGAWAEDGWERLRLPDAELYSTKPCGRCVVTTTDQITGERRGRQPLKMLARRRLFGKDMVFGMNLAVASEGVIRTGEPITS
ncbi:MOSC domain-containing protein [Flindersiella endophytica]